METDCICRQDEGLDSARGLAVMRPACHLDTQNTVFDSLDTQKFMSEFVEDDFFLQDRRCRSCSVTFIRHTKQYLA